MGRINLSKNTPIDLKKKAPELVRVGFGTGWEFKRNSFDLDIFAAATDEHKRYINKQSLCYFGRPSIFGGGIKVSPDNLTGKGKGVDEELTIDLAKLPPEVKEIYIGINIYRGEIRRQDFSQLSEAFLEIRNKQTNELIGEYDLDEMIGKKQACIIGKLIVTQNSLVFHPLLDTLNGNAIEKILSAYGLQKSQSQGSGGFLQNLFGRS